METPEILLTIGAVIIVAAIVFLCIKNAKVNKEIEKNSKRLASLRQLNKNTTFHIVDHIFYTRKHYDSRRHFNSIEPAYLMTATLKKNLVYYKEIINKIKENRENYKLYIGLVDGIKSSSTDEDWKNLKISQNTYLKKENNMFKKLILKPILNCSFKVEMTYYSRKRKRNYVKAKTFYFDNIVTCFESISRTYVSKATYNMLAAVERGEISDSLRYDILKRDKFKCVICGASASDGALLHVDHIIPISKGGKSTPSNLRTLCERCNIGKSNKIETIKNNPTKSDSNPQNKPQLSCPRCGADLVERKGKYGNFYGCSNFPQCKYTRQL